MQEVGRKEEEGSIYQRLHIGSKVVPRHVTPTEPIGHRSPTHNANLGVRHAITPIIKGSFVLKSRRSQVVIKQRTQITMSAEYSFRGVVAGCRRSVFGCVKSDRALGATDPRNSRETRPEGP